MLHRLKQSALEDQAQAERQQPQPQAAAAAGAAEGVDDSSLRRKRGKKSQKSDGYYVVYSPDDDHSSDENDDGSDDDSEDEDAEMCKLKNEFSACWRLVGVSAQLMQVSSKWNLLKSLSLSFQHWLHRQPLSSVH